MEFWWYTQDQPFVATLILMVVGRGVAQLITSGQIVTFNSPELSWFGSGSLLLFPTPVIIALLTLVVFWLLTRKTALGMFIEAVGINIRAAKKRWGEHPHYRDAHLCAERPVRGYRWHYRHGGYPRADANNAGLWLELDAIGGSHRWWLANGRAL